MKKFLIGFVLVALVVEALLIALVYILLTQATKGARIAEYQNPKKALLVIDIQEDTTGTTALHLSPYKGHAEYISRLNRVIEDASSKNILIVHVQQEFDGLWGKILSWAVFCGSDIKGSPGTEVDKRVLMLFNHKFSKPQGDSFANPELDKFLTGQRVNELYLTGLDPEFCIYATARGALNRGYKVNVVTDSVLSWRDSICVWTKNDNKGIFEKYRKDGIKLISGKEL
ncbi:MAG: cysteine hydrolase [Deltaproteobacteria bacterium]|nr:cysteine hydrolase [Deltaproteobacteria bacterium]